MSGTSSSASSTSSAERNEWMNGMTAADRAMVTSALGIDFTKMHITDDARYVLDVWLERRWGSPTQYETSRLWRQFVKCFAACAYAHTVLVRLTCLESEVNRWQFREVKKALGILREFAYAMHLAKTLVSRSTHVVLRIVITTDVQDAQTQLSLLECLDMMEAMRHVTTTYWGTKMYVLIEAWLVVAVDLYDEDEIATVAGYHKFKDEAAGLQQCIDEGFTERGITLWLRGHSQKNDGVTADVQRAIAISMRMVPLAEELAQVYGGDADRYAKYKSLYGFQIRIGTDNISGEVDSMFIDQYPSAAPTPPGTFPGADRTISSVSAWTVGIRMKTAVRPVVPGGDMLSFWEEMDNHKENLEISAEMLHQSHGSLDRALSYYGSERSP